jgi:hypothetical protein
MRARQFHEILRDAEVAQAVYSVVLKHILSVEDTTDALFACAVPRAANVARLTANKFR